MQAALTPAHQQQLHAVFSLFARQQGGAAAMGAPELGAFLAALAGAPYPGAPALLARYGGASGSLAFPAFCQLVCSEALPGLGGAPLGGAAAVRQELARVFSAADADGDGALSAGEVRAVLEADGQRASEAEVRAVLEEAGAGGGSGGGGITLERFLQLCVGTQVL
jgi:Ca2+-binding EF-hand superfamily protein